MFMVEIHIFLRINTSAVETSSKMGVGELSLALAFRR